jgi:di/tricarboxylate transporter
MRYAKMSHQYHKIRITIYMVEKTKTKFKNLVRQLISNLFLLSALFPLNTRRPVLFWL